MQEQRKKSSNLFGIIVAVSVVVVLVVGMLVWRDWEAKHKDELKSFVVTTEPVVGAVNTRDEPMTSKPDPELPETPEALLTMAAEALKDEGFFTDEKANKGFRVYYLLGKALDCSCDVNKAEELCKNLRERSAKSNYGKWFVDGNLLAELDEKIKAAKETQT